MSVTKVGTAYKTDCEPFADYPWMHGKVSLGSRPSPLCGGRKHEKCFCPHIIKACTTAKAWN